MHTLVSKPPIITIYCCEQSSIHLVIQNVNIGMSPAEFCCLNNQVQSAREQIDAGTWPCPYVALTYYSTVVCVLPKEMPDLAEAMQEAEAGIDYLLQLGTIKPTEHRLCQTNRPQVADFVGPN